MILTLDDVKTHLRIQHDEEDDYLESLIAQAQTAAEDFCRDHPNGIYILGPKEHAVATIFGDYWDSWDSGLTVPAYYFRRD